MKTLSLRSSAWCYYTPTTLEILRHRPKHYCKAHSSPTLADDIIESDDVTPV